MSVAVFSEHLGNWGPHRARDLFNEGTINAVYAKVWPLDDAAQANANAWAEWLTIYPGPLWAWMVCSADQQGNAEELGWLNAQLQPDGWVLNIEKPLEGAKLDTIVRAAKATGKPVRASLAGIDASHVEHDYRGLDKADIEVNWQAYADSGEGPDPATAVRELWESSFVIPGWDYRHRWGPSYGWGKVSGVHASEEQAFYDSYRLPGVINADFNVIPREWGYTVDGHELWAAGRIVGRLLGRARYAKTRVTILSDEIALDKNGITRTAEEWTAYAASARMPGLRRRPVDLYLAERCTDTALRAIAAGAGQE